MLLSKLKITILAGALLLPLSLYGQAEVSSQVDRSTITIGDLITYTVEIKYDPGLEILKPSPGGNLGQFQIHDFSVSDEEMQDKRMVQTFTYIISTYDTGEWEIPPTGIGYMDSSGNTHILKTQPITITVESILDPNAPPEIKDVKPPELLPRKYIWIYILAGSILGLAILIWGLLYWKRKRAKGLGLFEAETPKVPPYELAMQRLNTLNLSNLENKEAIKLYYIELSDILREYLEGRFLFSALEMTTDETLQELKEIEFSDENWNYAEEVLNLSDLVKFSKFFPSSEHHQECWERVYQIVEDTRPKNELQEEGESSPDERDELAESKVSEGKEDESI